MKRSLALGGEAWTLLLSSPGLLNEAKFAAYLTDASGPEMAVSVDPGLADEGYRVPHMSTEGGRVSFRAQQVSWRGNSELDSVEAQVGPGSLALERAVAGWVSARLVSRGGLMFHAAAVRCSKGAILLLGPSGAGKSTAARLSGDRGLCSNTVIVRERDGSWDLYTTPFTNADDPYPSEAGPFPLASAMLLEKAARPSAPRPATGARVAVLARALSAIYPPDGATTDCMLQSLGSLAASCPLGVLAFSKDSIELPD